MRFVVDHWEEAGAMPSYGFVASAATDPGHAALTVAADAQQNLSTRLTAAQSPQAQQAIIAQSTSGIQAAISGQPLTDTQIQSGFAMGATAALVATGVTATAALSIVAPLAAVVFGGGYAIGQAIQSLLGIHNAGAISCSRDDPTQYGVDPSDPKWRTYQQSVDSNGPPPNGWPNPDPIPQHWIAYTNGSFENWARPIIRVVHELGANCKPVPGARTYRDFANGLIAAWNAAAPAGSPTRKIGYVLQEHGRDSDVTYGSSKQLLLYRFANDPVQTFVQLAYGPQRAFVDRSTIVAGAAAAPWLLTVADPAPAHRVLTLHLGSLPQEVAKAKAASSPRGVSLLGLGLAGVGALALLKPKVLRSALHKIGVRA